MIRILLGVFAAASLLSAADERERFEMEVRPLLADNCWSCHRQSAMGGLRLDGLDTILKGGKSGPAVVPGKPDESLLIQAVTHTHERLSMPPQGKLTDDQIATLVDWVKRGAYWPPAEKAATTPTKSSEYVITPEQRAFWAFQPVRKPAPGSSIDRLVRARIAREGLHPVAPADKRTLIRRATFDLTGLPPTPQEIEAFLSDTSPNAFAKVVDRLLASPRYGERWARYWLDVARYSDDVFNSTQDDPYPNSFRYRNWVIRAFKEDLPYNAFVKAQIAGDQMPGDDGRNRAALGFYALSPEMQDDRVEATTKGFLGLTVACAQCHDHKFDPIPAKDFYSLQGVFAGTKLDEFPGCGQELRTETRSPGVSIA
jgi:mono/diheme cytochrome c family protein